MATAGFIERAKNAVKDEFYKGFSMGGGEVREEAMKKLYIDIHSSTNKKPPRPRRGRGGTSAGTEECGIGTEEKGKRLGLELGLAKGQGPGLAKGQGPGLAKGQGPGLAKGQGPGLAKGQGPGLAKGQAWISEGPGLDSRGPSLEEKKGQRRS